MSALAQPQTPTLDFEALKAVDDGPDTDVGSPAVGNNQSRSIGAALYKPAWVLMFTLALSYIGAVAFTPAFLPMPMQIDIDDPQRTATVRPAQPASVRTAEPANQPVELTKDQPAAPIQNSAPAPVTVPVPAPIAAPLLPTLINAPPKDAKPSSIVAAVPQPAIAPMVSNPPRPRRDATAADIASAPDRKPGAGPSLATIETGALPQVQATPARGYGVQIGNAPSLDTLRLVWSRMIERHRTQLSGIEPRFVTSDANAYVLIAGPFVSESEARRVCTDLATRRDPCKVRDFIGDGLF